MHDASSGYGWKRRLPDMEGSPAWGSGGVLTTPHRNVTQEKELHRLWAYSPPDILG